MIEVQTQPATKLPRDAKPSEIVRGLPESRWCAQDLRYWDDDGVVHYCAIGHLAEEGGIEWEIPVRFGTIPVVTVEAIKFVSNVYRVPFGVIDRAVTFNDKYGKDAAADWLEFCGY